MKAALALALLLTCACDDGGGGGGAPTAVGGRLEAVVVRPTSDTTRDTVRFEAAAAAHRCAVGLGVLVDGIADGNGVLLWLRPGETSIAGEYAYAARGDSGARRRTAVAAVRFAQNDVPRGVVLDSGRLAVRERGAGGRGGGGLSATLAGSGLANPGAVRVQVEARFDDVPAPRDTVPCTLQR